MEVAYMAFLGAGKCRFTEYMCMESWHAWHGVELVEMEQMARTGMADGWLARKFYFTGFVLCMYGMKFM